MNNKLSLVLNSENKLLLDILDRVLFTFLSWNEYQIVLLQSNVDNICD